MNCPCCGAEVPDVPIKALNEIPLGHVSREILNELVRRYPRGATVEETVYAAYRGGREPETATNIMRNLVSDLRQRLEPLGWTIPHNQAGRNPGAPTMYRLVKQP